ncbi:MAG: hypothetical protein ACF8R7_09435 [Phycisphaerales bacterium JB039]
MGWRFADPEIRRRFEEWHGFPLPQFEELSGEDAVADGRLLLIDGGDHVMNTPNPFDPAAEAKPAAFDTAGRLSFISRRLGAAHHDARTHPD